MPLTGRVLRVAAEDPDRPAIVTPCGRLSYAGLVDNSRRVVAAVRELHQGLTVSPRPAAQTGGIPVTVVSLTSAFDVARIVAGLAGFEAVSCVIDPRWPTPHQVAAVTAAGAGVVISDSADLTPALREAGWSGRVVPPAEFRRREAAVRPAEAPTVRDGREPFLLMFSSGTTDRPKGFVKTRRQYRDNFAVSSAHLEPAPGVATLAPGPVSYSLTLYALIECLASGGSAHLADRFDPLAAGRRIESDHIARVVAVPAMLQALTVAAGRDPGRFTGLELVISGGADLNGRMRADLHRLLPSARVISYYGAAEIGFIGDSRDSEGIRVYPEVEVQVRGHDGNPLDEGELGTVWVRAAACSDGYLPGTTTAELKGPDGWASVGDQGEWRDGLLHLAGRAGDVVATGGHKVALPEVDRAFAAMPGLGAACAVGLPSRRLGTVVGLVVESPAPDRSELVAFARQRLAPQFRPRQWYRVDALPRTVGGKIRRGAAADLVADGKAERL